MQKTVHGWKRGCSRIQLDFWSKKVHPALLAFEVIVYQKGALLLAIGYFLPGESNPGFALCSGSLEGLIIREGFRGRSGKATLSQRPGKAHSTENGPPRATKLPSLTSDSSPESSGIHGASSTPSRYGTACHSRRSISMLGTCSVNDKLSTHE
ncbi:hypothetical protein Vadar_022096 [Vaccinium darrowii]|uniref:Uncharacterized protein n=1 Tax=Vaccinium darrowii TaxID=229202 RepID=A0ACB7X325_9ERIC|nr:hypothetical protein Vadar_022096 [Vaccinium darrowii]